MRIYAPTTLSFFTFFPPWGDHGMGDRYFHQRQYPLTVIISEGENGSLTYVRHVRNLQTPFVDAPMSYHPYGVSFEDATSSFPYMSITFVWFLKKKKLFKDSEWGNHNKKVHLWVYGGGVGDVFTEIAWWKKLDQNGSMMKYVSLVLLLLCWQRFINLDSKKRMVQSVRWYSPAAAANPLQDPASAAGRKKLTDSQEKDRHTRGTHNFKQNLWAWTTFSELIFSISMSITVIFVSVEKMYFHLRIQKFKSEQHIPPRKMRNIKIRYLTQILK